MSNLIYVNFKTRQVEYNEVLADVVQQQQQQQQQSLNMFEQFDVHIQNIKNRFGEVQLPSYIYSQNYNGKKFDTYGFGNVHNSIHQYKPKKGSIEAKRWNTLFPMPADLRAIDTYLCSQSGKTLQLGYKSDAFQWLDQKYGNTKATLELANKYSVKLELHTMSDLVACDDYLDLVVAGGHVVKMIMGFEFESVEESRQNSPGAPSVLRRQKAVEKLQAAGAKVELVYKKRAAAVKKLNSNKCFATLTQLNKKGGI